MSASKRRSALKDIFAGGQENLLRVMDHFQKLLVNLCLRVCEHVDIHAYIYTHEYIKHIYIYIFTHTHIYIYVLFPLYSSHIMHTQTNIPYIWL